MEDQARAEINKQLRLITNALHKSDKDKKNYGVLTEKKKSQNQLGHRYVALLYQNQKNQKSSLWDEFYLF